MHDDDLRAFYQTYYAGYNMPAYDDAPSALKIRLRLAMERYETSKAKRTIAALDYRPKPRTVTVPMRKAG